MVIEREQILGLFDQTAVRSPRSTLLSGCPEEGRAVVYEAEGKLFSEGTDLTPRALEGFFAEVQGPSR